MNTAFGVTYGSEALPVESVANLAGTTTEFYYVNGDGVVPAESAVAGLCLRWLPTASASIASPACCARRAHELAVDSVHRLTSFASSSRFARLADGLDATERVEVLAEHRRVIEMTQTWQQVRHPSQRLTGSGPGTKHSICLLNAGVPLVRGAAAINIQRQCDNI